MPRPPWSAPAISPAYLGVGYIIGPRLASLNFAGGVIAWGLLVPLILFLGGPTLVTQFMPAGANVMTPDNAFWAGQAGAVWSFIVRPIAVGGMLVGACYTLFRMRKSLGLRHGPRRLRSEEVCGGRTPAPPAPSAT